MSYIVTIRRNSDRKVVEYSEDFEWGDGSEFIWSKGNFSCDCNRELFFERALGNEPAHIECGEDKYTILSIKLPSGETVYSEELK